tara:strand:- start:1521 stop:2093 length:573 start_codon:yes stop_codon:yes gene_type:complete
MKTFKQIREDMKTFKQIREAKLAKRSSAYQVKITGPTKNIGQSGAYGAKDHVKGKVIKFNFVGKKSAGIGTEQLIQGESVPGLQKDLIPIIKKNNIRSFSYGGKEEGPRWLQSWVKSNKNLRHVKLGPHLVIAAKEGYDISKDILKMFKDFNKKFGGQKAKKNNPFDIPAGESQDYLFHDEITMQFIEIY